MGFPDSSVGKESAWNAGNPGSIPGLEDPLEKGKATRSSILAWEFHGLYSLWGRKESDTTDRLSLTHFITVLASYVADVNFITSLVF